MPKFDAVTFTYLLRYVDDPAATMRELARVLKPGGGMASLEFGVPRSPLRALSLAGLHAARGFLRSDAWFSPREWYDVGRFLGPSISAFDERQPLSFCPSKPAGGRRRTLLQGLRRMSFGAGVLLWGVREPADVS